MDETLFWVLEHAWFAELARVDGCAPSHRWQITYECPNDGPCGIIYGASSHDVAKKYFTEIML